MPRVVALPADAVSDYWASCLVAVVPVHPAAVSAVVRVVPAVRRTALLPVRQEAVVELAHAVPVAAHTLDLLPAVAATRGFAAAHRAVVEQAHRVAVAPVRQLVLAQYAHELAALRVQVEVTQAPVERVRAVEVFARVVQSDVLADRLVQLVANEGSSLRL